MKDQEDFIRALEFLQTVRGQLIVSQALSIAIKQLETVPEVRRDQSNIEDMAYLRRWIFPLYGGNA